MVAAEGQPCGDSPRGLTLPSSGRSKGRFAPFGPPLMSNVRPRKAHGPRAPCTSARFGKAALALAPDAGYRTRKAAMSEHGWRFAPARSAPRNRSMGRRHSQGLPVAGVGPGGAHFGRTEQDESGTSGASESSVASVANASHFQPSSPIHSMAPPACRQATSHGCAAGYQRTPKQRRNRLAPAMLCLPCLQSPLAPSVHPNRGLTLPSSGRSKGRFAPFGPPLMSNVRRHRTRVVPQPALDCTPQTCETPRETRWR